MSDLPLHQANRLRKPSWRDSRLISGVLMILASTAIGAYAFNQVDKTVPMWAAKDDLQVGSTLGADDLIRKDVQLREVAEGYLSAEEQPPSMTVITRVGAGDLVPKSALGPADEAGGQQVTLPVDGSALASLKVGSVVQVYVAQVTGSVGGGKFADPAVAAEQAQVVNIVAPDEGIGAAGDERVVQILVPKDAVKGLVGSVNNGAKITLVPIPGGTPK